MNKYIFSPEWLMDATTITIIVAGIAAVGAIIAALIQGNTKLYLIEKQADTNGTGIAECNKSHNTLSHEHGELSREHGELSREHSTLLGNTQRTESTVNYIKAIVNEEKTKHEIAYNSLPQLRQSVLKSGEDIGNFANLLIETLNKNAEMQIQITELQATVNALRERLAQREISRCQRDDSEELDEGL